MPVLSRPEGDLWFDEWGHGHPNRLLVINGSNTALDDLAPLLQFVGRDFDVVSFDHRGFGRSAPSDGPYSMIDVAEDARAVIAAMSWQSCSVMGISFGGMVAQLLAIMNPSLVRRLALVCTSSGGEGGASFPLHELLALDETERSERLVLLTDTRFTPEWLDEHPEDRVFVAARGSRPGAQQVEAIRWQMAARRDHDAYARLGEISCPTIVASGTFDGIAPPENGRRMSARIPGAVYREYQGGHAFFVQDRTALPEILGFLSGGAE